MSAPHPRPLLGMEKISPVTAQHKINFERKELMNCKSCRKRKIKCNRLKPKCESCKVFAVPCIYDAIPKKRGPKTEIIENLSKRVHELERKYQGNKKPSGSEADVAISATTSEAAFTPKRRNSGSSITTKDQSKAPSPLTPSRAATERAQDIYFASMPASEPSPNDLLLDTYFARIHNRPYFILDEAQVRHQYQTGQLPSYLRLAIWAIASVPMAQISDHSNTLRICEGYSVQARRLIDVDEPSIAAIQSLLLLHQTFFAIGRGKKAYMSLSLAINMAMALELHRELPTQTVMNSVDGELRRQVFWTCYLLDRICACGSKRPMMITDDTITIQLPSWTPPVSTVPEQGDLSSPTSLRRRADTGTSISGSILILIEIARILGITNDYLTNGVVKEEIHFPWDRNSTLCQIRSELDIWGASNQDILANNEVLLARHDNIILLMSKLIYHTIHILLYRPFLPLHAEASLQGPSQHRSFQVEATQSCFFHANALTELASTARKSSSIDLPYLVGYVLVTAGTVHIHGAHYNDHDAHKTSAEYLAKEIQMLTELRELCAGIQYQKEALESIFAAHVNVIQPPVAASSSVFQLKEFFDRYSSCTINSAYLNLQDIPSGSTTVSQQQNNPQTQSNQKMALAHLRVQIPPTNFFHEHPQTAPIRSSMYEYPNTMHTIPSAPLRPSYDPTYFPTYQVVSAYSSLPSSTHFEQAPTFLPSFPMTRHEIPSMLSTPAQIDSIVSTVPMNEVAAHTVIPSTQIAALASPTDTSQGNSSTNGAIDDPYLTILEQFDDNGLSNNLVGLSNDFDGLPNDFNGLLDDSGAGATM